METFELDCAVPTGLLGSYPGKVGSLYLLIFPEDGEVEIFGLDCAVPTGLLGSYPGKVGSLYLLEDPELLIL